MSLNPYESPKSLSPPVEEVQARSAHGRLWFRIRIGLIAVTFVMGLFSAREEISELEQLPASALRFTAMHLGFGILLMPLMLLFVIGIQATNPLSDKTWTRPTHSSNPLRLGNPLLFFHFAAYVFGASGLGVAVSALWNGPYAAAIGLLLIAGAGSVLAGLRLSMWVFKDKMAREPSDPRSASKS